MRPLRLQIIALLSCCALLPASALGGKEQHIAGLVGNLLQQPLKAPDFTLTDQHGEPFHMAAMKGKVVVMSFIYTHCTDICPYIAVKVKDAYTLLGNDAANVVFVAVTTDPKRDIPKVTAAYSKALGLLDAWHFVGGSPEAVQAVWANYGIGVTVDPDTQAVAPPKEVKMEAAPQKNTAGDASKEDTEANAAAPDSDAPVQGLSKSEVSLAERLSAQFGGGYDVGHSAPFWIVDKKGMVQVGMDADATPADLVTNVRALLKLR
jgi:cytochrome oxidase Cu insertion factor (SCO1/SenC/PrrC family)